MWLRHVGAVIATLSPKLRHRSLRTALKTGQRGSGTWVLSSPPISEKSASDVAQARGCCHRLLSPKLRRRSLRTALKTGQRGSGTWVLSSPASHCTEDWTMWLRHVGAVIARFPLHRGPDDVAQAHECCHLLLSWKRRHRSFRTVLRTFARNALCLQNWLSVESYWIKEIKQTLRKDVTTRLIRRRSDAHLCGCPTVPKEST